MSVDILDTADARLDLLDRLMERYNAGDADGYAAFFAEDGCEAMYRGDVLRAGRDGVRSGNAKTFADFPQNKAVVQARFALGGNVVLHERVWRTPEGESFDVLAVYTFRDGLIERVEFIR